MSEPCMWLQAPSPHYVGAARERFENGRRIVERHPARGHLGDGPDDVKEARGTRYITVVRHDGHTVFLCLTNAASHLDTNTPWAQYQRAKCFVLGWFEIGKCPLAALYNGEMFGGHFHDQSIVEAWRNEEPPCRPSDCSEASPCRHALAEKAARVRSNVAYHADKMPGFQAQADADRANANALASVIAKLNDKLDGQAAPQQAALPMSADAIEQLVEQLVQKRLAQLTAPAAPEPKKK